MTITELATLIDEELQIRWCSNMGDWIAHFEHGETKEYTGSCILASESGRGYSPALALGHYVNTLKGKILVFNATDSAKRKEFNVPTTLTV